MSVNMKNSVAVRNATFRDAPSIRTMLDLLGYKTNISLLIENLFSKNDHQIFVCELDKEVAGFITVHYLPQIGNDGLLAIITNLAVAESLQELGIDKTLEEFVVAQSLNRRCEHIQVHCPDRRTLHHKFYENQGYIEYPKFFTKRLNQ